MSRRPLPDPSLPVTEHDLYGFTVGEKMQIRSARRAWLAANKDKIAAEKLLHARTCQICARPIHANKGDKIAHHGYQRPYQMGYQTASCYGARELPYERSRDALGRWIDLVRGWRKNTIELARKIRAGESPVPYRYQYQGPRDARGRRTTIENAVWCKDEFEWSWAQAMRLASKYTGEYERTYYAPKYVITFEHAREAWALEQDQIAANHAEELEHQSKRFNAWSPAE